MDLPSQEFFKESNEAPCFLVTKVWSRKVLSCLFSSRSLKTASTVSAMINNLLDSALCRRPLVVHVPGSTARSLSCFVVQSHRSRQHKLGILVSCTSWKWYYRSLARRRMKTRCSEMNVPLKQLVEAEHSHGSCKGIIDVVDGQTVSHLLALARRILTDSSSLSNVVLCTCYS